MDKVIRWALLAIGLLGLGFLLYVAKLSRNLGIGIQDDLNGRFEAASAQVEVLDELPGAARASREQRALLGEAAVTESLISFRVSGYYAQHGTFPASVEEIDSNSSSRQPPTRDPWGNPFRLVLQDAHRFLIISGGPSGNSFLTAQERAALSNRQVGRTYELGGKIVLVGGILAAPLQNEQRQ